MSDVVRDDLGPGLGPVTTRTQPTFGQRLLDAIGGRWLPWISTPILLVAFIFLWKAIIAVFNVSAFVLPQPENVARALYHLVQEREFWRNLRITLVETLIGFGIALVSGVAMGVVLGRVRWLEQALRPLIVASQVVPKVALIPLFIIWFGFGITSKVIVIVLIAFFPMMLNTQLGVRSVDPGHRDVMRSLNASRWATFWQLEYPSTLPYVLAGMEIGIVFAIIGAIVAEYLGGNEGLGYMIVLSLNQLKADTLFAVIVAFTVLGFLLFLAVVSLKRFLIPWHESVLGGERVTP